MKRVPFAGLMCSVALIAWAPTTAQAEPPPGEPVYQEYLLPSRVMCVHPTFTVTGSGWKVQRAVELWNEAQATIRLTMVDEPGCDVFYVHRYDSADDGVCGFTIWDRTISSGHLDAANNVWVVSGGDIYLNDRCVPLRSRFVNKRTVAHELGHAMGLPHTTSNRSVMDSGNVHIVPWRPLIAPVDVRDLAALYAGS